MPELVIHRDYNAITDDDIKYVLDSHSAVDIATGKILVNGVHTHDFEIDTERKLMRTKWLQLGGWTSWYTDSLLVKVLLPKLRYVFIEEE